MDGPSGGAGPSSVPADSEDDDTVLANSEYLTRQEVLKRRSKRLKRLAKCYRDHYWALMEELKRKHREFYWMYGKSPFVEDEGEERENGDVGGHSIGNDNNGNHNHQNGNGDSSGSKLGLGLEELVTRCAFPGCRTKAMALSSYCHPHILSDTKQKLYKGCKFVLKSTGAGPITCGKPILVSAIPSLCTSHVPKFEKLMKQCLRKEGAPVALSNRLASKFHLVIAEYVNRIQGGRRASASVNIDNHAVNDGA